ncbi:MAG: hypothetical protein IT439_09790 [Phycisphaerales bacterium]|nr:hypothetical protein [Phycisphaerales bacterium]
MDDRRRVYIVCGSGLEAERVDRPVAYHLARAFEPGVEARVCCDLWYINHDAARAEAAVVIGRPEVNALSAFLGDKLPTVFAVDDRLLVQGDPEWNEPVACCWGVTPEDTLAAVDAFIRRAMPGFLDAMR